MTTEPTITNPIEDKLAELTALAVNEVRTGECELAPALFVSLCDEMVARQMLMSAIHTLAYCYIKLQELDPR